MWLTYRAFDFAPLVELAIRPEYGKAMVLNFPWIDPGERVGLPVDTLPDENAVVAVRSLPAGVAWKIGLIEMRGLTSVADVFVFIRASRDRHLECFQP